VHQRLTEVLLVIRTGKLLAALRDIWEYNNNLVTMRERCYHNKNGRDNIVRTWIRDKFIAFRNELSLAHPKHT
jgi:hypothetical protein